LKSANLIEGQRQGDRGAYGLKATRLKARVDPPCDCRPI
jgi:hypothetical protein